MTISTIPRAITSRRHPLAFAAYAMVLMMGLIFVTEWLDIGAVPIFSHLHRYWIWLWEYELVTGGLVSLVTLTLRPRVSPHWPDLADLLHLEAIGAFVSACGVLTYLLAAISLLGLDRVGPSGTILGVLFVGLVIRSFTALSDARQVERLGRVVDAVKALGPEEPS